MASTVGHAEILIGPELNNVLLRRFEATLRAHLTRIERTMRPAIGINLTINEAGYRRRLDAITSREQQQKIEAALDDIEYRAKLRALTNQRAVQEINAQLQEASYRARLQILTRPVNQSIIANLRAGNYRAALQTLTRPITQRINIDYDRPGWLFLMNSLQNARSRVQLLRSAFISLRPVALMVITGLIALLPTLISLLGSLGQATGAALGIMAPLAFAAVGAFAALKLGLTGIIDGSKLLTQEAARLHGALNNWKVIADDLAISFQERALPGMENFVNTARQHVPEITAFFERFGDTVNRVFNDLANHINSDVFRNQFRTIMEGNNRALDSFGSLGVSVFRIVTSLAAGAVAQLERFAGWLDRSFERMADWLELREQTGQLAEDFERMGDAAAQWGRIFGNIFRAIFETLRAISPVTADVTTGLENITQRWADWSASTEGQDRIRNFFQFLMDVPWGDIAKGIAGIIAAMVGINLLRSFTAFLSVFAGAPLFGAAIAGMALLVGWLAKLYIENSEFRDTVNDLAQTVMEDLLPALSDLSDHIFSVFEEIGDLFGLDWEDWADIAIDAVKGIIFIVEGLTAAIEDLNKLLGTEPEGTQFSRSLTEQQTGMPGAPTPDLPDPTGRGQSEFGEKFFDAFEDFTPEDKFPNIHKMIKEARQNFFDDDLSNLELMVKGWETGAKGLLSGLFSNLDFEDFAGDSNLFEIWQTAGSGMANTIGSFLEDQFGDFDQLGADWSRFWRTDLGLGDGGWFQNLITGGMPSWGAWLEEINGEWSTFSNTMGGLWSTFWRDILGLGEGGWFNTLISSIPTAWNSIWTGMTAAWTVFQTLITTGWNNFRTLATTIWGGIGTVISSGWNAIWLGMQTSWMLFQTAISAAWTVFVTVVTTVWTTIVNAISGTWNSMWAGMTVAWQLFQTLISAAWTVFVTAVTTIWTTIATTISNTWNAIWLGLTVAWQLFLTAITTAWNTFLAFTTTIWTAITTTISNTWNAIWLGMQTAWQVFLTFITAAWNAFLAFATTLWTNLQNAVVLIWQTMWNLLTTAWQAFLTLITTAWNAFLAFATTLWTNIQTTLTTIWQAMWDALSAAWEAFLSFITAAWNAFRDFADTLFNEISSILQAIWQTMWDTLTSIWEAFRSFIEAAFNSFRDFTVTLFEELSSTVQNIWDTLWNTVQEIWETIRSALETSITTFRDNAIRFFEEAAEGIRVAWDQIREWVAAPVRFIIETVWNDGVGALWRGARRVFTSMPEFPNISVGFSSGGIYPGYTPGRDIGVAAVSGGEAIMRPEWTRAVGKERIEQWNRAARTGQLRNMGAFAAGGLVNGRGFLDRAPNVPWGIPRVATGFNGERITDRNAELFGHKAGAAFAQMMPGMGDHGGSHIIPDWVPGSDFGNEAITAAGRLAGTAAGTLLDQLFFHNPVVEALAEALEARIDDGIPEDGWQRVPRYMAVGVYDQFLAKVASFAQALAATFATGTGGDQGTGSSALLQAMATFVRRFAGGMTVSSGYRPGDPGYHGRQRAIDMVFSDGSQNRGSAGPASGQALAAANAIRQYHGANTLELIWDPLGASAVWNGRPHLFTGGSAGPGTHNDHIHWAFGGTVEQLSGSTAGLTAAGAAGATTGGDIGTAAADAIAPAPVSAAQFGTLRNATGLFEKYKNSIVLGGANAALVGTDGLNLQQIAFNQARSMGASNKVLLALFMAGFVESGWRNGPAVRGVDHDSAGFLQQRPSAGWGTVAQVENPAFATRSFVNRAKAIEASNPSIGAGALAQAVQISAFPGRYEQFRSQAIAAIQRLDPGARFDRGGLLPPGRTLVENKTGKPEAIFTYKQMRAFSGLTNNSTPTECEHDYNFYLDGQLIDVRVEKKMEKKSKERARAFTSRKRR